MPTLLGSIADEIARRIHYSSKLAEGEELGSNLLHVAQSSLGDPGGPVFGKGAPAGDGLEAALRGPPIRPVGFPGVIVEA
jgi:hypothetical protein